MDDLCKCVLFAHRHKVITLQPPPPPSTSHPLFAKNKEGDSFFFLPRFFSKVMPSVKVKVASCVFKSFKHLSIQQPPTPSPPPTHPSVYFAVVFSSACSVLVQPSALFSTRLGQERLCVCLWFFFLAPPPTLPPLLPPPPSRLPAHPLLIPPPEAKRTFTSLMSWRQSH